MTECEIKLAIVLAAVVIVGSALALLACIKMAVDCSREEERASGNS